MSETITIYKPRSVGSTAVMAADLLAAVRLADLLASGAVFVAAEPKPPKVEDFPQLDAKLWDSMPSEKRRGKHRGSNPGAFGRAKR